MSGGVRKNSDRADESRPDSTSGEPLYSHIRELAPRRSEEGERDAGAEKRKRPDKPGFFAHAARISMGTAFPALRSVARFLTLESYRTLPQHDRLPSLDDEVIEADVDELLASPEADRPQSAEQLLDWDELEIEELAPTPYRLYLFDIRIQEYLRQTKAQLSPLLLIRT